MEQATIKKVVIIGPESTGKSTLTTQLAAHYNAIACPEYARQYLNENGTSYTFDDLLTIAKGQIALEDNCKKLAVDSWQLAVHNQQSTINYQPLFIDTDMYVMKVWCEYVFGKCHQYILDEIVSRKYDLYLLCNIDLPWVKDALREYPDEQPRKELYHIYKDLLVNQQTPWVNISGNYNQRLQTAITAVYNLLKLQIT
jgi:NadR type nicotinamide-nucleotide adenylyltransferase